MSVYSYKMARNILAVLREDRLWPVAFDKDRGEISFSVPLHGILNQMNIIIFISKRSFTVSSLFPLAINPELPDTLISIHDFLNLVNNNLSQKEEKDLKAGNFTLDYLNGELRYVYTEKCTDEEPSALDIYKCIFYTIKYMSCYAPGIIDILYGWEDEKTSVSKCERVQKEKDKTEKQLFSLVFQYNTDNNTDQSP